MSLPWIFLTAALLANDPEPAPAPTTTPAPAPGGESAPPPPQEPAPAITRLPAIARSTPNQSEVKVNLVPTYEAGDVIKLRWKQEGEDHHEGPTITDNQKTSNSSIELDMTLKIVRVLPGRTYHCKIDVDRVVIDAATFNGREHYDSKDPKTKNGFFASPARILLSKPIEFGISADSYGYARKEHPRLREWYTDGTNLFDNTVGNDAFPARFGPLFGWLIDSASVGESWGDMCQLRVNNSATILTRRTSTLASNDGVQMEIDITGTGESAPPVGAKNLTFKNSTYDAKYKVNNASAKLRSGEVTHKYSFDYLWKGKPATVTTTVKETLERLD